MAWASGFGFAESQAGVTANVVCTQVLSNPDKYRWDSSCSLGVLCSICAPINNWLSHRYLSGLERTWVQTTFACHTGLRFCKAKATGSGHGFWINFWECGGCAVPILEQNSNNFWINYPCLAILRSMPKKETDRTFKLQPTWYCRAIQHHTTTLRATANSNWFPAVKSQAVTNTVQTEDITLHWIVKYGGALTIGRWPDIKTVHDVYLTQTRYILSFNVYRYLFILVIENTFLNTLLASWDSWTLSQLSTLNSFTKCINESWADDRWIRRLCPCENDDSKHLSQQQTQRKWQGEC